jgi:hypothetical protein
MATPHPTKLENVHPPATLVPVIFDGPIAGKRRHFVAPSMRRLIKRSPWAKIRPLLGNNNSLVLPQGEPVIREPSRVTRAGRSGR